MQRIDAEKQKSPATVKPCDSGEEHIEIIDTDGLLLLICGVPRRRS